MYRPFLFTIALGVCTVPALAQLPRIVVQGGGAPQVFTDLSAAVAAAQPNDHLYFSGGLFTSPAPVIIDKPLHWVGAGMHPDSTGVTGATVLSGVFLGYVFTTAASGSSVTGIDFAAAGTVQYGTDETNDSPVNMVFQRCHFGTGVNLGTSGGNGSASTVLDECVFDYILNTQGSTASVTRCILSNGDPDMQGTLTFSNCVFLPAATLTNWNTIVQNCVFMNTTAWASNNSQYNNCIFSGSTLPTGAIGSNNTFNLPAASIFVNETDGTYQWTDDLHLAGGSPGHNAGSDGTDIGLYGSASPYKPGGVPVNPHYRLANIANATDGSGNLPVSIKVAAQPN